MYLQKSSGLVNRAIEQQSFNGNENEYIYHLRVHFQVIQSFVFKDNDV